MSRLGQQAPAQRDLRVHVEVGLGGGEPAQRAEAGLRVLAAARDRRLDPADDGTGGPQLGDHGGQGAERGVVHDTDREAARGQIEVDHRGRHQQRADKPGVPGIAVLSVRLEDLAEPGDAGWQQGRVVDESCEQRRHQHGHEY
nr:hypothetical protein GCM10020092_006840 [Actinoplanes digitatis]